MRPGQTRLTGGAQGILAGTGASRDVNFELNLLQFDVDVDLISSALTTPHPADLAARPIKKEPFQGVGGGTNPVLSVGGFLGSLALGVDGGGLGEGALEEIPSRGIDRSWRAPLSQEYAVNPEPFSGVASAGCCPWQREALPWGVHASGIVSDSPQADLAPAFQPIDLAARPTHPPSRLRHISRTQNACVPGSASSGPHESECGIGVKQKKGSGTDKLLKPVLKGVVDKTSKRNRVRPKDKIGQLEAELSRLTISKNHLELDVQSEIRTCANLNSVVAAKSETVQQFKTGNAMRDDFLLDTLHRRAKQKLRAAGILLPPGRLVPLQVVFRKQNQEAIEAINIKSSLAIQSIVELLQQAANTVDEGAKRAISSHISGTVQEFFLQDLTTFHILTGGTCTATYQKAIHDNFIHRKEEAFLDKVAAIQEAIQLDPQQMDKLLVVRKLYLLKANDLANMRDKIRADLSKSINLDGNLSFIERIRELMWIESAILDLRVIDMTMQEMRFFMGQLLFENILTPVQLGKILAILHPCGWDPAMIACIILRVDDLRHRPPALQAPATASPRPHFHPTNAMRARSVSLC